MESTKQKTFRSKSLSGQRVSVRRKKSFNKVRLLFENNSKPYQTNRYSAVCVNDKTSNLFSIKTRYNQGEVIEEKDANTCDKQQEINIVSENINQLSIEERTEIGNDSRLVKNTINYFERRLSDKFCDNVSLNVTKKSNFDDIVSEAYGNRDKGQNSCMYQFNNDSNRDKVSQHSKPLNEGINIDSKNKDYYLLSDDLQQNLLQLSNIGSNYRRSLSTASVSSLSSDFVSFDGEPEIVFRKPDIKTNIFKPVPKQRTSIPKSNDKSEPKNVHLFNRTNDLLTPGKQQTPERTSILSQDSGISDTSQNSSFLWQLNRNLEHNSHQISKEKNNTQNEIRIQLVSDEDQIYEHIYEELPNSHTLPSNEWIDIEDKKEKKMGTKLDLLSVRRSQNLRPNNNYRKSFRPKLHKRRSNKTTALLINSSDEYSDNGSATEYEDIDEDQIYDQISNSVDLYKRNESKEEVLDQNHCHIYEMTGDQQNSSDLGQHLSIKSNEKKSNNKIKTQNDQDNKNESHVTQFESEPNIYTSTPRRLPILESIGDYSQRYSSIYINPNINELTFNSSEGKHIFQNQLSISSGIASYLELSPRTEHSSSPFVSQPLYQFYQNDVRRRAQLWIHIDADTPIEYDDYENNAIYGTASDSYSDSAIDCIRSSDQIQTLCRHNITTIDLVSKGPSRSLWCQLPQVINSKDNLLSTLSDKEKRFQESMFEIIASEASYCKSLNILVTHFYNCIEFSDKNPQILSQREKNCLFSNVVDISKISCNLLRDLEKRFEQNLLLYDICEIVYDYAVNQFQPYIHYCAYQRDQEKLLTKLTKSRTPFFDVLQRLESNQICQNQTLLSFLMLPMQRITRYPLLIDAVSQQLPPDSPILDSVRKALAIVNQLVRKCNEETQKVQRMQELIEIEKILHFRSKMKSYPIVSGARYLVKKGSVLRLSPQLSGKRTIGKSSTLKWSKSSVQLFLFSDLLVLTKKKSENNYSVFDYCSRSTVQLISLENGGQEIGLIGKTQIPIPRNHRNLCQLILLHNHESKSVEYIISFELESEKLRWIEAVSQPSSDNPDEVIYQEWDCPQVQCIKSYSAQQTDEISLEETDVLNVSRKMKDGWFEGQRIRDGVKGWFPSNYTEEIINQHVRARNIRQRYRLLMYSQSIIEHKKRAEEENKEQNQSKERQKFVDKWRLV